MGGGDQEKRSTKLKAVFIFKKVSKLKNLSRLTKKKRRLKVNKIRNERTLQTAV